MGISAVNKMVLFVAATGLFCHSGLYSENNFLYLPYGSILSANNKEGVSFGRVDKKEEMKESVLLGNLDKEGRALYFSLDAEGKKLARSLAAEASDAGNVGATDYRAAVQTALERASDQTLKEQERRLHNGMDRLSDKPKTHGL